MKYELEVEIPLPRHRVIELFDNADNLSKWQEGLLGFEHVSGEPGELGAKSKLRYKMGPREVEMVETIVKRNLPEEFSATYEAKGVWNMVENFFDEVNESTTRWRMRNEFKCSGPMKVLTFVAPGMFKKQTLKSMNDFRRFAESSLV